VVLLSSGKLADVDADSERDQAPLCVSGQAMIPGTAAEACGSGMKWVGFPAKCHDGA